MTDQERYRADDIKRAKTWTDPAQFTPDNGIERILVSHLTNILAWLENSDGGANDQPSSAPIAALEIPASDVKMLGETLRRAQVLATRRTYDMSSIPDDVVRLGQLIRECDRHRPLGSNGKHGTLHTTTCGCDRD